MFTISFDLMPTSYSAIGLYRAAASFIVFLRPCAAYLGQASPNSACPSSERGEEVRDGGRLFTISFDLMPTAPGILGLDQASEAPLSFPASDSTTSTSTCSI